MIITKINVSLQESGPVLAYASVVFDDCLIVKDIRVLRNGIVSMPSRKLRYNCESCDRKVYYLSNYCPSCGIKQKVTTPDFIYADICHPIVNCFRELLVEAVLVAVKNETQCCV